MGALFWVIGVAAASFTMSFMLVGDAAMMAGGFHTLAEHTGAARQERHPSQKWVFLFGCLMVGWGAIAIARHATTGAYL